MKLLSNEPKEDDGKLYICVGDRSFFGSAIAIHSAGISLSVQSSYWYAGNRLDYDIKMLGFLSSTQPKTTT